MSVDLSPAPVAKYTGNLANYKRAAKNFAASRVYRRDCGWWLGQAL
jgi:hypothetical protein